MVAATVADVAVVLVLALVGLGIIVCSSRFPSATEITLACPILWVNPCVRGI